MTYNVIRNCSCLGTLGRSLSWIFVSCFGLNMLNIFRDLESTSLSRVMLGWRVPNICQEAANYFSNHFREPLFDRPSLDGVFSHLSWKRIVLVLLSFFSFLRLIRLLFYVMGVRLIALMGSIYPF